jgi:hypothetical protein
MVRPGGDRATQKVGEFVAYQVKFIGDADLPAGVDWLIATIGNLVVCFIKTSRVCPTVLSEAWAAWEQRASKVAVSA